MFLEGNRIQYAFFVTLRGLAELAPFAIAYYLGKIIDFFTTYERGISLQPFYIFVFLIGIFGALEVWVRMYSKLHNSIIGARVRQRLREVSMAKLMDLELEWHEKEDSGSKIQKINHGSQHAYRFFGDFTNNRSISVLIGIFGSLAIFMFLGWKYALFSIVYISIFLFTEFYYNRKLSYWTEKLNKITEKVSGKIHESASNVLSVKALGLRSVFEKSTRGHELEYYRIWHMNKRVGNLKMNVTKTFAAIGYALFLLMVGLDFASGAISLGAILMYAAYFNRTRTSLNDVSSMVNDFIEIKSGVGRLMTILGAHAFDKEASHLSEVPSTWKQIEFRNVFFSYGKKNVLKNFNLEIKRGEKIGIVGDSGCGKSTLTKLLLGLYPIKVGSICIDGININKFKHSSLTQTITAVLQDSEMFDMTLSENIAISSTVKDSTRLTKAMQLASLPDVVKRLPKGADTLLGEKGYKLSGGERQRIGIARAVYKDSPVLLLDEATSHLDSRTEQGIQTHIEQTLHDKTMIIIAHRLSTLQHVDRIIVLDRGNVVEQGAFDELIRKRGKFFTLYQLQNRGQK